VTNKRVLTNSHNQVEKPAKHILYKSHQTLITSKSSRFLYTLNGIFKGLLKGLEQQIMGVCLQVIFRLIIAQLPNKRELSYFEGLLYFLFSLIVSQE
jgi:hypothetical protein